MRPDDEIDAIKHIEMVNNSMSENPSCASRIPFPRVDILWIGPHQVCHRALMRDLLFPVDESHLINGGQVGR